LAYQDGVMFRTCHRTIVVNGSDFPKHGLRSAGVAHKLYDALGRVANCRGVLAAYANPSGATWVNSQLMAGFLSKRNGSDDGPFFPPFLTPRP